MNPIWLQRLYRSELPDCTDEDYRQLLTDVRTGAIGPQLYMLLKTHNLLHRTPTFFQLALKQIMQACLAQNMLIKRETMHLLQHFEARSLPVILLKGTTFAEQYYGHIAARGTSDIDLLIKPERMGEAIACLQEAGYTIPCPENPEHYHLEWMKQAPGLPEPLTVELHWQLASERTARMNMDEAWQRSTPLLPGSNARTLDPTYTFYALCLHGASHQMDSSKYMIDLCHLLMHHREQIDLQFVCELAQKDRTMNRIIAALSITYRYMPDLHEIAPLPLQTHVRFWRPAHLTGSAGTLTRKLFELAVLDTWRYRFSCVLQFVLPSKKYAIYSIDQPSGTAVALPIAYYRLYKQRVRKLIKGAQEIP